MLLMSRSSYPGALALGQDVQANLVDFAHRGVHYDFDSQCALGKLGVGPNFSILIKDILHGSEVNIVLKTLGVSCHKPFGTVGENGEQALFHGKQGTDLAERLLRRGVEDEFRSNSVSRGCL